MKRIVEILSVAVMASAFAAEPYVGYVYPSYLRRGTVNTLVVGGQFFWNLADGIVSGPGVKVKSIELVPNFQPPPGDQRRHLVKWLDGIAAGNREEPAIPQKARVDEWRSNRWWRVLGTLDARRIAIVERFLNVPRNPLQDSPSLRQTALIEVEVAPDAPLGVRDFRLYGRGGVSAPRPVIIGDSVALDEPLYRPPARKPRAALPRGTTPCVFNGQIMPGETDSFEVSLRADCPVTFRMIARELQPFIGDAVPGYFNATLRLLDPDGREVRFADDDLHRPDPLVVFLPPRDGVYRVEVRDNLFRGRADFVYALEVLSGVAGPFARGIYGAGSSELPDLPAIAEFSGSIDAGGDVARHRFRVPDAGKYVVEVFARRLGSPLDARLSVSAADGVELASVSDVTNGVHLGTVIQAECDPECMVEFPAAGEYVLSVGDDAGKGGRGYFYRARVRRPAPRFEAYAMKSGFTARTGGSTPFKVVLVRRDGFSGSVRLVDSTAVRFYRASSPSNLIDAVISPRPWEFNVESGLKIMAEATIDGVRSRVPVQPCDEYEQAFAWKHLLPARSFVLQRLRK